MAVCGGGVITGSWAGSRTYSCCVGPLPVLYIQRLPVHLGAQS